MSKKKITLLSGKNPGKMIKRAGILLFHPDPVISYRQGGVYVEFNFVAVEGSIGLADGLADSQQKIVELIIGNPRISKREMSEKIGISTTAIDKNISMLKKKRILTRVGSAKRGYWQVSRHE